MKVCIFQFKRLNDSILIAPMELRKGQTPFRSLKTHLKTQKMANKSILILSKEVTSFILYRPLSKEWLPLIGPAGPFYSKGFR